MPHWLGYLAVVLLSLYLAIYPDARRRARLAARQPGREGRSRTGADAAFVLVAAPPGSRPNICAATLFTGYPWDPLALVLVPARSWRSRRG